MIEGGSSDHRIQTELGLVSERLGIGVRDKGIS
jgi:hypothetical protein